MIVQIDKLKDNEIINLDFEEVYAVTDDYMLSDNNVKARFVGTFSKEKDYFKLEGDIFFDIVADCSRCLAPVTQSFEVSVLEYFKNTNEYNDVESDDNFFYFNTLNVDLTEALLINIQLHIPPAVLCDTDCEGLCQYCGVNLNSNKCSCEKPIDPRWDSLKSLLNDN